MTDLNIKAIDLFCGVGGLTHGLQKSGIPVVAGVDIDESCKYAFEANNDAMFIAKDIKTLDSDYLSKLYPSGSTKVLVGCAPCQPFSKHTQKNKKRSSDGKWRLLYHFSETIEKIDPVVVSMENVPQLAKQKVFTDFVRNLERLKYFVNWNIVFCPDYGIPQNRMRLVLLASKLGEISLLSPTHKKSEYKTVADVIKKKIPIKAGEICLKDSLHRSASLSDLNLRRIQHSKPGGSWRDWDESMILDCHKKKTGKTYSSVYGRMKWEDPSPTITTQFFSFGTGRFGHPEQDRALSLREGALLQTFPAKYQFIDKKNPISSRKIGEHIGNAVPVKLGEIIGKTIKRHLKKYEKK